MTLSAAFFADGESFLGVLLVSPEKDETDESRKMIIYFFTREIS